MASKTWRPTSATGWTDSGNVTTADGQYATALCPPGDVTPYLVCTFPGGAIPDDAIIDGVEVRFTAKASAAGVIWPNGVAIENRLCEGGATATYNDDWGTLGTTASVVGAGGSDDTLYERWEPSSFNSPFTIEIEFWNADGSASPTVSVDDVVLTVSYTEGPGVRWSALADASDAEPVWDTPSGAMSINGGIAAAIIPAGTSITFPAQMSGVTIPAGRVITGIEVGLVAFQSLTDNDLSAALTVPAARAIAASLPPAPTGYPVHVVGGPADLWGGAWDSVNLSTDFALTVEFTNATADENVIYLDALWVGVYYRDPTVTVDRGVAWDARAATPADRSPAWAVRSRATATRALSWHVRKRIARDRVHKWNVQRLVAPDRVARWNVRATAAGDRVVGWDVRETARADRLLGWNIAEVVLVTSHDRMLRWDTHALGQADRAVGWGVVALVTRDAAASWDVRTIVRQDAALVWALLASVEADRLLGWGVLGLGIADRDLVWVVRTQRMPRVVARIGSDRLVVVLAGSGHVVAASGSDHRVAVRGSRL